MLRKIISCGFDHKITKTIIFKFLSDKKQVGDDLILIRHAQSSFNTACEQYRKVHNISYVWKELCNHQGFDQKVLFNLKYVDCQITEKGRKQCQTQRSLIQNEKIDCILVSPQIRALQTCQQLFKQRQCPVIVQPLLVGPLRSCSDINKSTEYKKLIFPNYNFKNTEKYQELWYLDYLPESQKKLCYQRFQQKNILTNDQKRAELVELMKQGKIYEDSKHYRERIQQLKKKIKQYRNYFSKIAIVAHYYTIQYLSAVEYMECGTPQYYIDVENCKPYYCSTKQLTSVV